MDPSIPGHSTLGDYRLWAGIFFGDRSKTLRYIEQRIKNSSAGENKKVTREERETIDRLFDQEMMEWIINRAGSSKSFHAAENRIRQ